MKNCPYGYRRPGDVSVHCKVLEAQKKSNDYCAHQYLCNRSRRWEVSPQGAFCPVREEKEKND